MGTKNAHTWTPLNAVDMSSSQISAATDVQNTDNIGYVISWVGTSPVGTISVEVSNDLAASPSTWQALSFGSTIAISGNSGSHDISINQLPYSKIRIKYNRTSGTGTLSASMTNKRVGG